MASRKDFIEIAEGCITTIKRGHVKKKDVDDFIQVMSNACNRTNYNFDYNKFRDYIIRGVR